VNGQTDAEREEAEVKHERALAEIAMRGIEERNRLTVDALGRAFSTHRSAMETARRLVAEGREDTAFAAASIAMFQISFIIRSAEVDGTTYQDLMDIAHADAIEESGLGGESSNDSTN
jgi:hypothetical protein